MKTSVKVLQLKVANSQIILQFLSDLQTTDTRWRHKSKTSENFGQCGRQNMLRPYPKDLGVGVDFRPCSEDDFTPGVHSPCSKLCKEITFQCPSTFQPNMKSWWNLKISWDFSSRNYLEISQIQEVSLQSIMIRDFVATFEDPVKTIDTLLRFSYLYHRVTLEQFS